ncbi:hypothetical protein B0T36_15330 [Nocardia donostiensis]|uniref:helix-turn-helix domain-containing protein n=1 Tax=Nocardia donostiensis TaxID=1538463 RepID=UPI0009D93A17|nr:helix-turn-helix transcriptional regulator [Nocardia donostiensis]OQS14359.1 hypothetical protein B0T36_15330 [Nocardia donostiensis]
MRTENLSPPDCVGALAWYDLVTEDENMAQRPLDLAATESAQQFFGAELRHRRQLRNLSLNQLGTLSHDSGSLIGKIEKAQRRPTREFAQRMDEALETGGLLERMWLKMNSSAPEPERTWQLVGDQPSGASWVGCDVFDPVREWLEDSAPTFARSSNGRHIGSADIDVMWSMCDAFANADHHLGGGYARATLARFIDEVVGPAVQGTYDSHAAPQLYAVAARLCDLSGFMCFDSARQGLGQQYFRQALRLAKASGNAALGAHILTDMSMQAHYLDRPLDAVWLGTAAVRIAEKGESPATAARCNALLARAHALAGNIRESNRAMLDSERALNRARHQNEPDWIRFFTERQLSAEFMYVAHDSCDVRAVQRLAPLVLADSQGMERRQVLVAATFAASYVTESDDGRSGMATQVEQACGVLREALKAARTLVSARGIESINSVRRRLARYADVTAVKEVEEEFQATVALGG